jgi:predicted metalloprotease with PDZ domain
MPLIGGTNFRTVKYGSTEMADYYLHIAADDDEFLLKNDSTFFAFTRLADEAEALFGGTHFDEYHFLLTVSNLIPGIGLEHRNSSLNGVNADAFKDVHEYDIGLRGVITHEFVHAWCGKYRRPEGMNTPDYQTNKNMDLLWIYEGLTTYLGSVLKVRAGFIDVPTFLHEQANILGRSYNQKGRQWRSLRDTQVANYTIRKRSDSWGYLRRNQDYYFEGAMIWLDFDIRIREATNGKKSLDDFCTNFFSGGDPTAHAISFDLEDVISVLNELTDKVSWAQLIDQKINQTEDEFNPEGITLSGYKFTFFEQKSDVQKRLDDKYPNRRSFHKSIGMDVEKNGIISNTVPGGPADRTGLYDGVKVVGVNGKTFNIDRLENAVRNTTTTGKLTFLTLEADNYCEYEIYYKSGLRYDKLEPIPGQKDWLTEICSPSEQVGAISLLK